MIKMVTRQVLAVKEYLVELITMIKKVVKKDIVLGDSWEIGIIMMNKLLQHKERIHMIRR